MRFRYRWQQMSFVAIIVLWGLFKLNLFSASWNIAVGLVITAVLFILTGLIGND
jgi:low affinity Fe/Cu permease